MEIFFYKSGGGITCDSNVLNEYQELIDKIYLPFKRKKKCKKIYILKQ